MAHALALILLLASKHVAALSCVELSTATWTTTVDPESAVHNRTSWYSFFTAPEVTIIVDTEEMYTGEQLWRLRPYYWFTMYDDQVDLWQRHSYWDVQYWQSPDKVTWTHLGNKHRGQWMDFFGEVQRYIKYTFTNGESRTCWRKRYTDAEGKLRWDWGDCNTAACCDSLWVAHRLRIWDCTTTTLTSTTITRSSTSTSSSTASSSTVSTSTVTSSSTTTGTSTMTTSTMTTSTQTTSTQTTSTLTTSTQTTATVTNTTVTTTRTETTTSTATSSTTSLSTTTTSSRSTLSTTTSRTSTSTDTTTMTSSTASTSTESTSTGTTSTFTTVPATSVNNNLLTTSVNNNLLTTLFEGQEPLTPRPPELATAPPLHVLQTSTPPPIPALPAPPDPQGQGTEAPKVAPRVAPDSAPTSRQPDSPDPLVGGQVSPGVVADLIGEVGTAQFTIGHIQADGDDNRTDVLPGLGTMFTGRLDSLRGTRVMGELTVTLPKTLLEWASGLPPPHQGAELLFTAVAVEEERVALLGSDLLAAAVLELQWRKGPEVEVENMNQSVVFSLPVTYNDTRITCVYWDPLTEAWSTNGVWLNSKTVLGGTLWCETTHFSLFGAILQGIIATIVCTNFDLFREGAIRQLWQSHWYTTLGAILLEGIIGVYMILFFFAAILDCYRARNHHFNNEFFLVQEQPPPTATRTSLASASGAALAVAPPPPPSSIAEDGCNACCRVATCCCSSSAFKEALDDVCSNWFEYFSETRTFLEEVCGSLTQVCASPSRASISMMGTKITTQLMFITSRRATAASMGISEDLVAFLLEDKDFADYMTREHARISLEEAGEVRRHQGKWTQATDQFSAWSALRREVGEALLKQTRKQHNVFTKICHLFFYKNPVSELFMIDIFQSCKQKAVLMGVDLLCALTFCSLFFQGVGLVRGRPVASEGMCAIDDDASFGFRIGRFLVIGAASLFMATVPVAILESLQTKGFKLIQGGPDSEAWNHQLRTWVVQERLFWFVALVFHLITLFYVTVFLANINDDDHYEWAFAGVLSLIEDFVVFPLALAAIFPLLAKIWVVLHGCCSGTTRETLVRHACEDLHRSTNMMLPIETL